MIDAQLYVACLVLKGRKALVVGAGAVGLEKTLGLLACEAEVTVVAPAAGPEVSELAAEGRITLYRRDFETGDLDGQLLVVAATPSAEVNRAVHRAAETRSMLVNVADVPALCSFILPAITRHGPLTIAVSTSGASPALAKRIRQEIETRIGPEYARLAELLDQQREWAHNALPTYQERKAFFESIVAGSPDPIELLRNGDEAAVRDLIEAARRPH